MKKNNVPMRRCIGCMESKPKKDLIRIAYYDGELAVDKTGRAKGRGVYLCRDKDCFAKAVKKRAIQRSFDGDISQSDVEKIMGELDGQ